MKEGTNYLKELFVRYSILLVFGILSTNIFYFLFTSLTLYPVYLLLSLIFNPVLIGEVIFIQNTSIEIIGSCVAASAYYLLLILNLSIPNLDLKKRIKLLLFTFVSLLTVNIARIFVLSLILVSGNKLFDVTHKLFWYFGSTLFVVLIWFIGVKKFKIKEIPFYSDFKFLLSTLLKSKTSPKNNKPKKIKKNSRKNSKKTKSSKKN